MGEAWFRAVAEELSRCFVDARECATVCERFIESQRGRTEAERGTFDALVAPTAVARVLIDLIDEPPQLVLAAVRLCRDCARTALAELATLEATAEVRRALETMHESCEAFLDAVD